MDVLTLPSGYHAGRAASMAHDEFAKYMARTRNTICGRHPIGVLLGAVASLEATGAISLPMLKWVRYEQSSRCATVDDSSVSYASAYVKF